MSVVRYRKRPVEVDTIQWTGHNIDDLIDFTGGDFLLVTPDEGTYSPDVTAKVFDSLHDTWVGVKTGQHVVRGVKGEFYPIAEDVLAETYELAEEATTEATATPDFFHPGRSYTRTYRYSGVHRFDCEHLTTDPKNGRREAWGWTHREDGTRRRDFWLAEDYPHWAAVGGDGRD